MTNPTVRLILRAVIAGAIAALAVLKASIGDGLSGEEWVDLVTAFVVGSGALSILEATTSLNPLVGWKKPPANVDDYVGEEVAAQRVGH